MEVRHDLLWMREFLLVELKVVNALGPCRIDIDSTHWNTIYVPSKITLFVCLDKVVYFFIMDQVPVEPNHVRMGPFSIGRSLVVGFKQCKKQKQAEDLQVLTCHRIYNKALKPFN